MYSYGLPHMAKQKQDDQLEHTLLYMDTGCCPEDLPETMNDREKWRERVRDIRASNTTGWWWWYIYVRYRWNKLNSGWSDDPIGEKLTVVKYGWFCFYNILTLIDMLSHQYQTLFIYRYCKLCIYVYICKENNLWKHTSNNLYLSILQTIYIYK